MENFSQRITAMQASPIRKLTPYAEKAKADGKKIYHLNIGQPDIETPKNFMEAIKSFDEKVLAYTASQGIPQLIQAIIRYYKKYNMHFEKDEVLITNGGSEALLFTLLAIADYGDEVIIPEPFYTNYAGFNAIAGIKTVPLITEASSGFHLPKKEEIEKLITNKTKAILVTNPGNPTGAVFTEEEVNLLADIAKKHNLFIISDEVYREFVYNGLKFKSFGSIPSIKDQVILIDSVSKRFSACGARIGAILSKNKKLIAQILKICQGRLCCPTLEQIGAAALYDVPEDYFKKVLSEYQKRRDILYSKLQEIPGVVCQNPEGAFYVIAKLPVKNAEEFIIWLLKDFDLNGETVMFAPAQGFYITPNAGEDEVRIAYILNENDLKKAMDILKVALKKYPKRK
ncbi:pyridoxal phosphate-dependent aminotransferase [Crassaminicella indica]|uniref:Pyridoxal phosphate-dependent aminotransferase n=1 Tax=Crassaminicella indica TaxID=2855394 RepID=A0ABX8RB22_9CLOT|nr:pyridoxal phosphate-dependent aminotransferase [Crassaminicella indica]QXM05664.1 pyridoxal phosphate-dependent aminotransferase [Crassaminicella indica]